MSAYRLPLQMLKVMAVFHLSDGIQRLLGWIIEGVDGSS
jgi:hypothetical protein